MCVHAFEEENNGHYYCVTCSRPKGWFWWLLCGMWSERRTDVWTGTRTMDMDWHQDHGYGLASGQWIWTGIRTMEFHILNNIPSVVIIMC